MSTSKTNVTYDPLNVLKPVAADVWIVDGPTIRFGPPALRIPFPTRMTVVRLKDGGVFIHSPTMLAANLRSDVERLGRPQYLVAPNRLHYWWVPDWQNAFPDARIFLAPRVTKQAAGRLNFPCTTLDKNSGYPWDAEIATLLITGSYMTEAVFLHRATRTLVLTDLIENFETSRINSPVMRLLTWIGGVRDPQGSMPRDMRMTFPRQKLKSALQQMIDWDPERIIIAHGRWYDRNGRAELIRAFQWLLR
jgi:Domain of unknown function (DUF4336)